MPDKYKPDEVYVRHIPNRRLHSYTFVQILMLLVLCTFKVIAQISIVFPIMVSLFSLLMKYCLHVCIVLRWVLNMTCCYTYVCITIGSAVETNGDIIENLPLVAF